MASGYPGGGGGPEFYGVGGRSMPGGPMNSGNNINPQIPGIFLDQIGNRISSGNGKPAINAFLLRSVKPRTFQSPAIDISSFGGSSQRYVSSPFLPNLRYQQTQQQSDYMALTGVVPCIEPVQNLNRVEESSESMLNSLRELEKQLLDDEGASTTTSVACSRQTVLEIATAIAEGKTEIASEILARVSQTPSQRRNSEEKLVDFMVTALRSRINPASTESSAQLYGKEHILSTQLLYELSPCFKLGFMAANLAILDANDDATSFHVVDFEIGEGGQYFNLLHALSTRRSGKKNPLVVKITAVTNVSDGFSVAGGDRGEGRLKTVGDRLSELGDRLGISLKFNVVAGLRLSGLSRESLGCDPEEPLAVNLAFKLYRVPDESVCMENPRDELLRRVKGLNPSVVTLVEEEMNSNTAPFLGRVSESCACYGALLDSVESTVPSSNSDRARVEEGIGRKLINAVACEGIDRVERCEVFGKWRMRMSMAGFELMPVSEKIAESMKSRLSNGNRVHPGFTVKEENGGVCFGWMGRTLAVASAWR
ncbi:Scarecrow-like protein 8 [Raphanus sativus]|nr:Scarecrow-like protein 8 [Raphanus sativus]